LVLKSIPHKYFISPSCRFLLSKPKKFIYNSRHVCGRIFDYFEKILNTNISIPTELDYLQKKYLDEASKLFKNDKKYIGFSITAGHPTRKKEISLKTIAEVANYLSNKNFVPTFFIEEKYKEKINFQFNKKKNGIIGGTSIFVETYICPIKVIIVGAVHIAQYLVNFAKSLNFEISIIDPRGYFASEQRFPDIKIINKWPKEAFAQIKTDQNTALIALTHDPKIDDPALQHALKNKFFYIGALGSKKTHANRCTRLKEAVFNDEQISNIFGPIGIKLGGRSAPEIALSIIAQLVSEVYKK